MKLFFCLGIFFCLTANFCQARLGETLPECKVRYGEPYERKLAPNLDEMVLFKQEGMKIGVGLKDGLCVVLILGRESGEKLNPVELEKLLAENSGDSIWKKRANTNPTANVVWVRGDDFAVAQFAAVEGILTLVKTTYMKERLQKPDPATM